MKITQKTIDIIVIVLAVILFLGGFIFGYNSKKCSKIKKGVQIVTDTVIIHDTTIMKIPYSKFKTVDRVVTRINRDTINNSLITVTDTAHCYGIDTTISGAFIAIEFCSSLFPHKKPIDLSGILTYTPPPDTNKTIFRIDTIHYKKPWFSQPQTYIILSLATIAGTSIYFNFN